MSELGFVTDNQRQENFSECMRKLSDIKSGIQLLALGRKVMDEQKRTNNFYFPKGGSKQFWDEYKKLKAYYSEIAIQEVEMWLEKSSTVKELKRLKQSIYSCNLFPFKPVKEALFERCDEKIAELEQAS